MYTDTFESDCNPSAELQFLWHPKPDSSIVESIKLILALTVKPHYIVLQYEAAGIQEPLKR